MRQILRVSRSEATNQATREEWRELGFFYDQIEHPSAWRLVGSEPGLRQFPHLLAEFASNPANESAGEHQHYGPYFYLVLQLGPAPDIDASTLRGRREDFTRLAELVTAALDESRPGDRIEVGREWAPSADLGLILDVREAGFDPASEDPALSAGSAA